MPPIFCGVWVWAARGVRKMSFILQYAKPAPAEPEYPVPVRYDSQKQLLVFEDGTPVCENKELIRVMGTTTSTAGSKTHFDD